MWPGHLINLYYVCSWNSRLTRRGERHFFCTSRLDSLSPSHRLNGLVGHFTHSTHSSPNIPVHQFTHGTQSPLPLVNCPSCHHLFVPTQCDPRSSNFVSIAACHTQSQYIFYCYYLLVTADAAVEAGTTSISQAR